MCHCKHDSIQSCLAFAQLIRHGIPHLRGTPAHLGRIVINRQGVVESVLLDIKKASMDAHFTPAQFASSGGMDLKSLNSDEPRPIDEAPAPSVSPAASQVALTGVRPTLVPSHFKSLKQLRGQDSMRHFQKANPPGF
jgi:hypothetical protein